jgi:hypothetical protein
MGDAERADNAEKPKLPEVRPQDGHQQRHLSFQAVT